MWMERRGVLLGLGLCTLSFVLGCNVYDPSLIEQTNPLVPSRPAPSTSTAQDSDTLVFALKDIFVNPSADDAANTGIDLDAMVTASREGASCEPFTIDGELVGQPVIDGSRGVDNSLAINLLPAVGATLPCLEDNIALTQGRGVGTVVLWIRDWNGMQDDASISALLTTSVDGTREDPALVGFRTQDPYSLVYLSEPTRAAPGPAWESEDSWFLDPVDFELDSDGAPSLQRPKREQLDGYVAEGRLVVPLTDHTEFKLIAGDGSLETDGAMVVVVNGGFLIADLSDDRGRLERGLFAGRFSIEDLAAATPKIGICDVSASIIENLFGQFADIHRSPSGDGMGLPCDAFSMGITFTGMRGRIAGLASSSRPTLQPCEADGELGVDRCCPSQWLSGESRADTCSTLGLAAKAARFDALPATIEIPIPAPELLE